jgi:hypothetical protein
MIGRNWSVLGEHASTKKQKQKRDCGTNPHSAP